MMAVSPVYAYPLPVNPMREVYSHLLYRYCPVLCAGGAEATLGSGFGITDWLLLYQSVLSISFSLPAEDWTLRIEIATEGGTYHFWRAYPIMVAGAAVPVNNCLSGLYIPAWSCRFIVRPVPAAGGPYGLEGVIKLQGVT